VLITDLSGRLLRKQDFTFHAGSTVNAIDEVSELPEGVYMLTVAIGDRKWVTKLVK
jgi:hypothetical protein